MSGRFLAEAIAQNERIGLRCREVRSARDEYSNCGDEGLQIEEHLAAARARPNVVLDLAGGRGGKVSVDVLRQALLRATKHLTVLTEEFDLR